MRPHMCAVSYLDGQTHHRPNHVNEWIDDLNSVECPQEYDSTECGFAYSTAEQVSYCSVQEPPTWPALLQLPDNHYTGEATNGSATATDAINTTSAPLLYTGNDRSTADSLMAAIFARNQSIGRAFLAFWILAGRHFKYRQHCMQLSCEDVKWQLSVHSIAA